MRQLLFSEFDWDDAILRLDGVSYPLHTLSFIPDTRGTPFIAPGQTPAMPDDRYVLLGPDNQRLCQVRVSTYEKQAWWRFEDAIRKVQDRQPTTVLLNRLSPFQDYSNLHGSLEYVTAPADAFESAARSCLQAFRITHPDTNVMFADYRYTSSDNQISVLILYARRVQDRP